MLQLYQLSSNLRLVCLWLLLRNQLALWRLAEAVVCSSSSLQVNTLHRNGIPPIAFAYKCLRVFALTKQRLRRLM
jgi:hypothetical protein